MSMRPEIIVLEFLTFESSNLGKFTFEMGDLNQA